MKKEWIIRVFLLIAYCVPFAFLSVNGDATSGTILFYGVMIAGFALLGFGALKTNNVTVLYIGNVLSFVSSCAAAKLFWIGADGTLFQALYFPLTYCGNIGCCTDRAYDYCADLRGKEKGKQQVIQFQLWYL